MRDIIERYENRLRKFGYSPETLGWGKQGRQEVRFGILAAPILDSLISSVLDIGCGFADFYDYLISRGWHGNYLGIDIVPGLLQIAKERHPFLDLRELDITGEHLSLEKYDYVVASGVFNARLKSENNLEFIECGLRNMYRVANMAICVDFMSTYVDFQHPDAWHTEPAWVFALAKTLSKRVLLRHDYMPFEFALIIYCDDRISPRNVFQSTDDNLELGKFP